MNILSWIFEWLNNQLNSTSPMAELQENDEELKKLKQWIEKSSTSSIPSGKRTVIL